MTEVHKTTSVSVNALIEQFDYDEEIILDTSFSKILTINCIKIRDSVFQLINTSDISTDYMIYGSTRYLTDSETADPRYDDGWINLLSPASYNHLKATKLPASKEARGGIRCDTVIVGDTVTVNGLLYTAVAGVKTNNTEFSIDTSNKAVTTDLADSINKDVRTGTLELSVTAISDLALVFMVSELPGDLGNEIQLSSSTDTRLVVTPMSGGKSARSVETLSNVYKYIIVMAKGDSGISSFKIWHRGQS